MSRMDPQVKADWVADLRSGLARQGRTVLHNEADDTWCCLGRLTHLAHQAGIVSEVETVMATVDPLDDDPDHKAPVTVYDGTIHVLPTSVMVWAGLDDRNPHAVDDEGYGTSLAAMNDEGLTFEQIADVIEAQL